jgi:hypothetical protein
MCVSVAQVGNKKLGRKARTARARKLNKPCWSAEDSVAYALRAVAVLVLSSSAISRQLLPSWRSDSILERLTNLISHHLARNGVGYRSLDARLSVLG